MGETLFELLKRLETIGDAHEELYDSEVREQMGDAIVAAFIRPVDGYVLPTDFGLYSPEANAEVRSAIGDYVAKANPLAIKLGLSRFHERLAAFQDDSVQVNLHRDYEDFFGHMPAEGYDEEGCVID